MRFARMTTQNVVRRGVAESIEGDSVDSVLAVQWQIRRGYLVRFNQSKVQVHRRSEFLVVGEDGKAFSILCPCHSHRSKLVRQVGGTVQTAVHQNTDVIVVGQRSKLYKHKLKGKKLKAAELLNRKGARIRFVNEPQFMRLVRV